MRNLLFIILVLFMSTSFYSQKAKSDSTIHSEEFPKFQAKDLIIPGLALGYGFLALDNSGLKKINRNINKDLVGDREVGVDNFTLYIPVVATYAIDLFNHKANHSLKDRTIILLTATALNNGATFGLKAITNEKRPGEDKYNSFPSGHTSNAFMAAEFLRQEFRGQSPWYGIGGYAMAFTTAYLRMYNNKHWFSDVVAGAGLGILSMQTAYWVYPWLRDKVFKGKNANWNGVIMPNFDGKNAGFSAAFSF